jgi:hypothetical protein
MIKIFIIFFSVCASFAYSQDSNSTSSINDPVVDYFFEISELKGKVKFKRADPGNNWYAAQVGMKLSVNDSVKTDSGSSVTLINNRGELIEIPENSQLKLAYKEPVSDSISDTVKHAVKSNVGHLLISSDPISADIFINDRFAGKTPKKFSDLAAGRYFLDIVNEHFFPFGNYISVIADSAQELNYTLLPCAYLSLNVEPADAVIRLNNKKYSPGQVDKIPLKPGKIIIKVNEDTYRPVEMELDLEHRRHLKQNIKLEHTKAFLDSVENLNKQNRMKRFKRLKIVLAAMSVGFGGAGLYLNYKADKSIQRQNEIYDDYQNAGQGSNFDKIKNDYNNAGKEIDYYIKNRDALYKITGACVVCFGISLIF